MNKERKLYLLKKGLVWTAGPVIILTMLLGWPAMVPWLAGVFAYVVTKGEMP